MADKGHQSDTDRTESPLGKAPAPPLRRRRWPWLVVVAVLAFAVGGAVIALVAGGAALVAPWRSPPQAQAPQQGPKDMPKEAPLDGELIVIVRPPERGVEPLPVEQPGALPVRAGGTMSLEVHFNQPAFGYLVWLDSSGRAVPLYPWNHDRIEVEDLQQPPKRWAAKALINPPIGMGWKFGEQEGMETVLLLARRTPLAEGSLLPKLFAPLPPSAKMRLKDEVVVLGLDGGADSVSTLIAKNRGDEQEALAADEPLHALMIRLGEHFEMIRAVRFAHEGE